MDGIEYYFAGFVLGGAHLRLFYPFLARTRKFRGNSKHFVRTCSHDTLANHFMRTMMITLDRNYEYYDHNNHNHGPEAYSRHDKFPLWWESVRDDDGGNLSVTKSHH